jgi:hypothetical protein
MTDGVRLGNFRAVKISNRVCVSSKITDCALVAVLCLAASGCFGGKDKSGDKPPPAFTVRTPSSETNVVVTPISSGVGRVASVNEQARFAVISFPFGQLPANDTRLSVFHAGRKTGEVKITGPA